MQINGIARQLLSPLQFDATPASSPPAAATSAGRDPGDDALTGVTGSAFHEILSHYDMTNTTPKEFSALAQELHDSGEINDAEFRELSRMRLELEQDGQAPDDVINLVDFFENKLRDQTAEFESQRAKADPQLAATLDESTFTAEAKRQLDWVKKFALVHAAGADAVDVGA